MDRATASASKHHRPQNGPRRVASRVNLAGLFKARKKRSQNVSRRVSDA